MEFTLRDRPNRAILVEPPHWRNLMLDAGGQNGRVRRGSGGGNPCTLFLFGTSGTEEADYDEDRSGIHMRTMMPNVADHRSRSGRTQYETEAPSRRSAHLLRSANGIDVYLAVRRKPDAPRVDTGQQ